MERLGRWRDKATGINPFVPGGKGAYRWWHVASGIARLPAMAILWFIYLYIAPIPLVGRAALWLSGVLDLDYRECCVNEELAGGEWAFRNASHASSSVRPSHAEGDIIISNGVCWLDQLVLNRLFPAGSICFPEGARTNNRGVLRFDSTLFGRLRPNDRIRIVALKYDPVPPSSAYWIFPACRVVVKSLSPEAVWATSRLPPPSDAFYPSRLQACIAAMAHLRPLQLDRTDFEDFCVHNP